MGKMLTSAGERDELDFFPSRMMNNNVLVKIDFHPENGHIHRTTNLDIEFAGCEYNESAHVARYGTVVLTPSRLISKFTHIFSQKCANESMDWITDLEIEDGDTVYFTKSASANAPMVGNDYFIIPYSEMILRVRSDEIYPLNGYALLEKKIEKTRREGLILDIGDYHNKRSGIVTHVGRPNDKYFGVDSVDADIQVGDEVVFGGEYFGFVEEEMFASLPREMGYVQRRWINATV